MAGILVIMRPLGQSLIPAIGPALTEHAMRIAHVIDSLNLDAGGPPMVVIRLAAAQCALGHDVTVLTYAVGDESDQRYREELTRTPGGEHVTLKLAEPRDRKETVLGARIRAAAGQVIPECDFAHLHGVWETILRSTSGVARAHHVPYAVAPHGMLDPWSMSQKRLKKQIAFALGYRKMLDRAAFLHCLNRDEARLIEPLGLRSDTRILPNGVFRDEVDPLPDAGRFRAEHPEMGDDRFVLFLSRLHYKKGLDFLADAFAKVAPEFADVRLVVAGPDGGAQAELEQQIARHGLTERTHLVGSIYGPMKYAALVDAACFCLPSRQEGFSMAITEAMACATPVVVSEDCHYPEVAEAGAGRVVPLNADAVAEGLRDLLRDDAAAAAMGEAGRRLVLERFTWNRIAERAIGFYEQVLQRA